MHLLDRSNTRSSQQHQQQKRPVLYPTSSIRNRRSASYWSHWLFHLDQSSVTKKKKKNTMIGTKPPTIRSITSSSTLSGSHKSWLSWSIVTFTVVVGTAISVLWYVSSIQGSKLPLQNLLETRPRLYYRRQHTTEHHQHDVWTFTILQLADIHLGEAQDTDWGPEQDRKTWRALSSYLDRMASVVDLIVLSGDQLTANDCYNPNNATLYYKQLGLFLATYNIPYAIVFGNHDDMAADQTHIPATTRQALVQTMQQNFADLSLLQAGPRHVRGISNYWVDLYYPSEDGTTEDRLASRIAFLDTGGGQFEQRIDESQLQWFVEENHRHRTRRSLAPPVVTFAHIPTQEFDTYQNTSTTSTSSSRRTGHCVGDNNDQGIAPLTDGDAGLIATLSAQSNVHFLAVGHNHGNDYCCPVPISTTKPTIPQKTAVAAAARHNTTTHSTGTSAVSPPNQLVPSRLHLCFGRHSGHGGYGSWDRGARVYELQLRHSRGRNRFSTRSFQWKSWVLMESGLIQHSYNP